MIVPDPQGRPGRIPTLNQYGMLLLILLMMGVGAVVITRRV